MVLHRSGRAAWGAAIALLLVGFLVVGFAPGRADAQERFGRRLQMVALTNQDREAHHRRDLTFQAQVSRYAKEHSRSMSEKGYIYHSTEEQLLDALGDVPWSIGGENVGVGGSLDSLQRAFMASKFHRQNILRKTFDHMAVGIVRADGSLWITVIFYG
ncbi:MAG: CAP domain-containing protein [Actinomycetota bacterium]